MWNAAVGLILICFSTVTILLCNGTLEFNYKNDLEYILYFNLSINFEATASLSPNTAAFHIQRLSYDIIM